MDNESPKFNERFRITITMDASGNWNFSIIGLHTLFEVQGLMTTIVQMLGLKAMNSKNPDLIKELTNARNISQRI